MGDIVIDLYNYFVVITMNSSIAYDLKKTVFVCCQRKKRVFFCQVMNKFMAMCSHGMHKKMIKFDFGLETIVKALWGN